MRSSHGARPSPRLLFSPRSSWLSPLRIVLPCAKGIWSPCQRPAKSDGSKAVEFFPCRARLLGVIPYSPACCRQPKRVGRFRTGHLGAPVYAHQASNLLCRAFPDRMVASAALSCGDVQESEDGTNINQPHATHHTTRRRAVLARHARARPPRRRHFRPRRALHAHLLPSVVPGAQATAPQRHLLPHARGSRTQRLPSLLALPPQRNLRPGCAGSACRRPSRTINRREPDAAPTRTDARRNAIHSAPGLFPRHRSEAPRTRRDASPKPL